jgi:peptidyl-prolyl cis-trans isomerase D
MEELDELVSDFKLSKEDSMFARVNSDGVSFYNTYTIDQLPEQLKGNYSNLSEGDVRGPYFANGNYVIHKISRIFEDSTFAARASHILIKWADPSDAAKAEARSKARRLLNRLRSGADFAELARENSEDGSAQAGGDLGWFGKGQMVAPFEEAVLGASRPGLINDIIETQFGYHIISVTEPANYTNYKVASVERTIVPSDETRNLAFRNADMFSASAKNYDDFLKSAERDSLEVFTATDITAMDRRFNDITSARSIVQWAYSDDIDVGDVSSVRETEDSYIIAVLTKITEPGTATFESVREQLVPKVKNQKKGEIIMEKLAGVDGDLAKISEGYGQDAKVYSSSDLKYTSNSLPSVGFVPEAIGKAFALNTGGRTKPFEVENGILILEMVALTPAPEIADYSSYKNQIEQRFSGRMSFAAAEAIKEDAEIVDRRFRYF